MERKKWTPKSEITDSLLKFREKRKWQLALRRYVLEKNASSKYAYYFGLGIEQFRNWIEIQFTEGLNWENFGSSWQFDHIIPLSYFDFTVEEDLLLCWNFLNIRVEKISLDPKQTSSRIDIIAARHYFNTLFSKTGFTFCLKMVQKINSLENSVIVSEPAIEHFILQNKVQLELMSSLTLEEFNHLNTGMTLDDILLEREIIKKFS